MEVGFQGTYFEKCWCRSPPRATRKWVTHGPERVPRISHQPTNFLEEKDSEPLSPVKETKEAAAVSLFSHLPNENEQTTRLRSRDEILEGGICGKLTPSTAPACHTDSIQLAQGTAAQIQDEKNGHQTSQCLTQGSMCILGTSNPTHTDRL